jgi:CPA2 family monovalent cation:H+ antiporter-2
MSRSVNHLPPMIIDLAVILCAAAVSTLIFSKLRQPVVLGYLIAGFAVGPHFPLLPAVVDKQGVALWAEIGVIFLLFSLGLEFSFKKLAKVGKSAFISATFEILTMSGLGYLVGRALGWTTMDSVYLGAILSMSSTTIIIRAFGEAGLKGKAFASLVFGILIVEDLMAILLMVILAAISIPGSFSGSNLAYLSMRLVFFLMVWFLVGIYVVPTLLGRVRKYLSNEIMLIVSIGLCFMMVVLATKAEFSAAIGAFIMGSILAETEEGERIEHLLVSVKDLFAAVFFVSVGMMIDPAILQEHFGVVVLITALTIFGKLFGSGFGAVLSGRSLKHSTQAGMSLAQIGEFSFIIATLGVSLKVVSDFLYPIIIAVSAVTTFTTPYMIRYSEPMYSWIELRLPKKSLDRLSQYGRAMSANGKENALGLLWKTYGPLVLLNSVVVLAIGLSIAQFGLPILISTFGDEWHIRFIACVVTLVVCMPFLYGTVLQVPKKLPTSEASSLLRLSRLHFGAEVIRAPIGLILIAAIINEFATTVILPLLV